MQAVVTTVTAAPIPEPGASLERHKLGMLLQLHSQRQHRDVVEEPSRFFLFLQEGTTFCVHPATMRFTETFTADCRSSTIALTNKPSCNGSSTLTAFDPATGRATCRL